MTDGDTRTKPGPNRTATAKDVATLLHYGKTPREIAEQLGVSRQVIYTRMAEIREYDPIAKVGGPTLAQLVAEGKRDNLFKMLQRKRGVTTAEAAKKLGCSVSSARRHVRTLRAALVEDGWKITSTGGRLRVEEIE